MLAATVAMPSPDVQRVRVFRNGVETEHAAHRAMLRYDIDGEGLACSQHFDLHLVAWIHILERIVQHHDGGLRPGEVRVVDAHDHILGAYPGIRGAASRRDAGHPNAIGILVRDYDAEKRSVS